MRKRGACHGVRIYQNEQRGSSPHEHHFCRESAHYNPVCSTLFTVYGKLLEIPVTELLRFVGNNSDIICHHIIRGSKSDSSGWQKCWGLPEAASHVRIFSRSGEAPLETTPVCKIVMSERFMHIRLLVMCNEGMLALSRIFVVAVTT